MIAVVAWQWHDREQKLWVIDTDRILPANDFERDVYAAIMAGGHTELDGNAYSHQWGQFYGQYPRSHVDLPQVVSKAVSIKVNFE